MSVRVVRHVKVIYLRRSPCSGSATSCPIQAKESVQNLGSGAGRGRCDDPTLVPSAAAQVAPGQERGPGRAANVP